MGLWDWFSGSSGVDSGGGSSIPGLAGGSYGPLLGEAGTDAATGTGSGGGSWWGDIMSSVGKGAQIATPLLGLGATGLGLYSGIKGMQQAAETRKENQQANEIQRQAATSALGSGQSLTSAGTSAMMGGPLPEGLEAQAQQWEDAYRAQVRNYLAKAGQSTSSAATQWEPYIKQQAALYRQQLASGLLQPGTNNLNVASGSAARAVGQNQATQPGIASALELANRTLASLQAASGEPERRKVA